MSTSQRFEIFDKAKWHFSGNFPEGLDIFQGYIHTGFYIGWLIKNDLVSEELRNECKNEINDFLENKITAVQFYESQLDGVFSSDDVNDEGYNFTKVYFDFEKGTYLKDYEAILCSELPTLYHVQDGNENFEKITVILNERLQTFRKQQKKSTLKEWIFKTFKSNK